MGDTLHLDDYEQDVVSNPLRLRVAPPRAYDEEFLAQDFFSEDVGRVLNFDGSHVLSEGIDTLREVAEQLSDRKVALHVEVALANSMAVDYRLIDFDQMSVKVKPSNVEEARKEFAVGLLEQKDQAAESLGHIDYKYYVDRFSDWLTEKGDAREAAKMQEQLKQTLSDRKVIALVLEDIQKRADSYK